MKLPHEMSRACGVNTSLSILFLLICSLFLSSACSNGTENAPVNSNAPMSNTSMNSTNTTANSNSISKSANTARLASTVNERDLKDALKDKLMQDKGGLLSPDDWARDAWLEKPVGA